MATTTAKKNPEVLTPEIIQEVPLEQVIDNTLVKNNVTDKVIASLKEKYGNMKLVSVNDKESYLEISEARKEVRRIGILAEKCCKLGREDAVKIQKLWLAKEKEVLGKIAEVQDPLDAEIKKFDDEQERIKHEEVRKQEEKYINRQATLSKYGAQFMEGSFVLNHISYELSNIKEADDEVWNDIIVPKYKAQFEKNESVRVEEENKREQAALILKQQQEELERQQRELREGQEKLKLQQESAEREIRLQNEQREAEEKRRKTAETDRRINQLRALGMSFEFQNNAYTYSPVSVDNAQISSLDNEQWGILIQKITPVIEDRKILNTRLEEERIQKEKDDAIAMATERERLRIESERIENERLQKEKKEREAEELAKGDDKTKWNDWLNQLSKFPGVPEMKSPTYKNKANSAKEKIDSILFL